MLVMIRRDRHWLVLFIFNRKNELFRISTKLAFLPTFGLPVGHTKNCAQLHTIVFPMRGRMFWLALFTEQCLDQPIIPYRGAISDAISDHVGKQIASLEDDIRFSDVSLSVATNVSTAYIIKEHK